MFRVTTALYFVKILSGFQNLKTNNLQKTNMYVGQVHSDLYVMPSPVWKFGNCAPEISKI